MNKTPRPIRFIDALAATLRERGWTVKIEETEDCYFMSAIGEGWDCTTIFTGAYRSSVTGRWNLADMSIFSLGRQIVRRTYSDQGIGVHVYGTDYVGLAKRREAVTA